MIRGKELAQAVLDLVTKHPERHRQSTWVTGADGGSSFNPKIDECGTRACLAGWAVILNTPEGVRRAEVARETVGQELGIPFEYRHWDRIALKLLFPGLDVEEFARADDSLMGDDEWEKPERRVQRAFFQTWDNDDAVQQFAAAFDLEVPTHE